LTTKAAADLVTTWSRVRCSDLYVTKFT